MNQLALFDYQELDTETRIVVQQRTSEIKALMKRTAQDIIEIGQKLIEVKERLPHGAFGGWLESEFGWHHNTANNFMRVAEKFTNFVNLESIAPSALYLLASPSTPEPARQEAIERAQSGEAITHTKAKEIVAEHKPAPSVTFESAVPVIAELVDEDEAVASVVAELRKMLPDPAVPPALLRPVEELEIISEPTDAPAPWEMTPERAAAGLARLAADLKAVPVPTEDNAHEDLPDETGEEQGDNETTTGKPVDLDPAQAPPPPPSPAPAPLAPPPPPPPPTVSEAPWQITLTVRGEAPPLLMAMRGGAMERYLPEAVARRVIAAVEAVIEPVAVETPGEWLEVN